MSRGKVVELLKKIISNRLSDDDNNNVKLIDSFAINCERAILNWTIENCPKPHSFSIPSFSAAYKAKARMICWNLKFPHTNLVEKCFIEKKLSLTSLMRMTHEEILPRLDQSTNLKEYMISKSSQDVQGVMKCRRCHSYKTEYSLLQTRSGDEGSSVFLYCHNCGNRAKFS